MDAAVEAVVKRLDAAATPVNGEKEIAHVATISAQDATIGSLIGEAFTKVGKDGVITVEESQTATTELEFTEGMQFDKGYISPYFVTDLEAAETVLDDPYLLITTQKISSVSDLLPLLEKVVESGKPLVIVAEDVDGEALSTLVVNAVRRTFSAVAVKAPFFGDRRKAFLQDLAIITGAQVVSPEVGLKLDQAGLDVLGKAGRVVVTKDNTTITHGAASQSEVDNRIAQIRREIEDTDSDWDREKLQERLAKLSGGVGVIKVGAATEVELKERKHRIEDAIAATRAAVEEGINAGGGAALVQAAVALDGNLELTGDEATGVAIVRIALDEPLRWIAANAGEEGYVVVAKVRALPANHGLNAATGEYGDLLAEGVVDPVKVTKAALQNAASVAALILSTQSAIVEKPADEDEHAHNGQGGHGHGHSHGPGF
jgi:chaperonin GroEL